MLDPPLFCSPLPAGGFLWLGGYDMNSDNKHRWLDGSLVANGYTGFLETLTREDKTTWTSGRVMGYGLILMDLNILNTYVNQD